MTCDPIPWVLRGEMGTEVTSPSPWSFPVERMKLGSQGSHTEGRVSLLGRTVRGQKEVSQLELLILLPGWPSCVGEDRRQTGPWGTQRSRVNDLSSSHLQIKVVDLSSFSGHSKTICPSLCWAQQRGGRWENLRLG